MRQSQIKTQGTLLDASNQFYQEILGYKLEQTRLQTLTQKQWQSLCEKNGLNKNSSGVYSPRNQTAIVKRENPLSLFHEYFGHGLYCEQSLAGRKLVDLEKRLLEEEKRKFQEKKFSLKDVQRFRAKNKTFQELEELRKQKLMRYELFAIWTEYLLSKEFGLKDLFARKYDSFPKRDKKIIESVINFNKKYGDLATFYAQGLAKVTTPKRIRALLEDIFGEKSIKNSRLVLLTGSKKPFSDIDLFASSNKLQSAKNSWLDLIVFDENDFERRTNLFEVQVIFPIMTGEFVAGDSNYLQQKRKQLQEQPITEESIRHNLKKSKEERIASEETKDKELKRIFTSYSQTYLANALALKQGKRLFTKEDLLEYLNSKNQKKLEGSKKNAA